MQAYQQEFIDDTMEAQALLFGSFVLKSGRNSPYFFNAAGFNTGTRLMRLGTAYAAAILASSIEFDILYGPAYKGIPLAAATAIALSERRGSDVPFCFNRKETKDHGEGGITFGAPLRGRVLIIDDVISAGTSVSESVALIRSHGAVPAGIVIALDRMERGYGGALSAIEEIKKLYHLPITSIVTLDDFIERLEGTPAYQEPLARMRAYRKRYATTAK